VSLLADAYGKANDEEFINFINPDGDIRI